MERLSLLAVILLAACTPTTSPPTAELAKPTEATKLATSAVAASPSPSSTGVPSPAVPQPALSASPSASPSPSPAATSPAPSTTQDRVGFPEGYQTNYKQLFAFDRPDNKSIRVIYGNDQAAAAQPGQPFPYGSLLVMENYRAQ